jgi:Ti-type conjugative transfer relaxase TraA
MLNIGRMAPGRADYYLSVVADRDGHDAADYYLAPGEEPGRWLTAGGLALEGTVRAEQLRAVLDGRHPATGEALSHHPARRVPGFDLTYRPPKSVSLLWALGDRDVAAQVVAAHDAAVAEAVGYLEREAGFSRRGAGGAEAVKVDGFVAAAFRHRTSRADDPLLHTHVLIANVARTTDDRIWRTLDSRRLYAHAKTAGVLYQAQLRWELTRRLGVAWQPVVNGVADLAGVDRPLIEAFSARRAAIVEQLAARGESSAKAAQVATLTTRQAKGVRLAEAELRARWRLDAEPLGIDDHWYRRLLGRASPRTPEPNRIAEELIDREGLTATSSTFTRRDLIQAVAERLPTGLPVALVERLAAKVLAHDPTQLVELGITRGQLTAVDTIRRADGRLVAADPDGRRYTTRGLLLLEQHAITTALDRSGDGVALVDEADVDRTLRRRTLSAEQAVMVRRLTTSGAGVEVAVGKAGTGKTYALDAARHAWNTAGVEVSGVALAARAALELQETAGIRSTTLASLLHRLDTGAGDVLPSGSVLVVDEAGMVGTRQLARLLQHAADRDAKVVLVGDPHQLPEIDAGGLYRALTTRLPVIELTDNRRQTHGWEQAALDELRHGDPAAALDTYRTHGRIITADIPDDLRERLVDDWWDTARSDPAESIMIGLRRADVDDLNHRARARLHTARRLTGPTLHAGGTELQAGDRIVCLRNHRRLGVVNGTRATIRTVDPHQRAIDVVTDDGRPLVLDRRYLDAGHVAQGYAITGHKAQGLTVEHTYVLGSQALYREWGYVALSRGRQTNRLYQHTSDRELDEIHTHAHQPDDPHAALAARMTRTRAQQPVTPELRHVADRWRHLHVRLHGPDIARARTLAARRATLARRRQAELEQLERLQRRIDRATAGLGRITNRHIITDLRDEHDARTTALTRLDHQLEELDVERAGLPTGDQTTQLQDQWRDLARQLDAAARHRVASCRLKPSDHLLRALGPMPVDRGGRERWQRAAISIEGHRLRWDITDPDRALGPEPDGALQQADRRRVIAAIEDHQRERQVERGSVRTLAMDRRR